MNILDKLRKRQAATKPLHDVLGAAHRANAGWGAKAGDGVIGDVV